MLYIHRTSWRTQHQTNPPTWLPTSMKYIFAASRNTYKLSPRLTVAPSCRVENGRRVTICNPFKRQHAWKTPPPTLTQIILPAQLQLLLVGDSFQIHGDRRDIKDTARGGNSPTDGAVGGKATMRIMGTDRRIPGPSPLRTPNTDQPV